MRVAASAASSRAVSSHLEPLRVLPERRLPAEWSLPGHWPAQLARWRGGREAAHVGADLGEHHLGGALLHAGDRAEQLNRRARKGRAAPRSRRRAARSARRGSRGGRGSPRRSARAGASKRPSSASLSAGIFARSLPLASSASTSGSVVPATSASSIARPETPRMSVATQSSLIPVSSSDLVQPVGLALALVDLRLAVAGQVPQRPDRLGRHEARPQQPRLQQLAQPGGVGDVGLAARHLLDVPGVDEQTARSRPRGSPRPASSRRRSPPSPPASPDAPSASRAAPTSPRTVVWNSATSCCTPATPAGNAHARRHLRLVHIQRRGALDDRLHRLPPLERRRQRSSPAGASETDESDGRALRQQSGVPGRLPRQTNDGLTGTIGERRQRATRRSSPISPARAWPRGDRC